MQQLNNWWNCWELWPNAHSKLFARLWNIKFFVSLQNQSDVAFTQSAQNNLKSHRICKIDECVCNSLLWSLWSFETFQIESALVVHPTIDEFSFLYAEIDNLNRICLNHERGCYVNIKTKTKTKLNVQHCLWDTRQVYA